MSESQSEQSPEDAVREAVTLFLRRNFPQIEGHGGDASITEVDLEDRRVAINLSGACSGCGVSSMTTQAIKQRLPAEIDPIDYVDVGTGFDGMAGGTSGRDVPDDVPF